MYLKKTAKLEYVNLKNKIIEKYIMFIDRKKMLRY